MKQNASFFSLRKPMFRSWVFAFGWLGLLLTTPAWSAEHVIHMLNVGADGPMVFEPAYVRAEVGDTLRFVPTNTGHFIRSLAVPEGATPWLSSMDQVYEVRMERPGLYFYNCPPHLMMGMVGLVQVGRTDVLGNRTTATEVKNATKGRVYSQSGRIDALLEKVK
jgi:pseudoazurin